MSAKGGGRVRPPGNEMSKFTKEQLIEYVKGCIEHAERFPGVEIADKEKAIFEIALTALTAQPVGWMTDVEVDELQRGLAEEAYIYRSADSTSIIPLYTTPAASVVPCEREDKAVNHETD